MHLHITQKSLPIQNTKLLEKFVTENFEKIKNNLFENKSLEELRDFLLPKLLSGLLNVEKAA